MRGVGRGVAPSPPFRRDREGGRPVAGPSLLIPLLLLGSACASAPSGPPAPVVSPTGIVYPVGTPPTETRWSQTAALYLRSDETPERALAIALEGRDAEPGNPVHHYLAGVAWARMGDFQEADASFAEAERIYPAYALDVEPEREAAWAAAFNAGAALWADGDVEGAIRAWEGATTIFSLRPEAHRNLAMLLQDEGRYPEAIQVYQAALEGLEEVPVTRILPPDALVARDSIRVQTEANLAELLLVMDRFAEAEPLLQKQLAEDPGNLRIQQNLALALSALGREEEAAVLHAALLADGTLETAQLFNLGVALFRAADYPAAAEAFQRLTQRRPRARDVWFNYTNALFAAEDWPALAEAGARLLELDPLNENASLIAARAHLEAGDEERAIAGVQRIEGAPVHLDGLILRPAPGGVSLQGRVVGNAAEAGTEVALRFTFFSDTEALGSRLVTVEAPGRDEVAPLEVQFPGEASGWMYEVVEGG